MWLATQHGFYSIVQKAPDEYHVRGRVRKDLENLLLLIGQEREIHTWEGADYRYRIILTKRPFTEAMAALALDLDYPNFKSQIACRPDQLEKLNSFHHIWSLMAKFQEGRCRE